MSTKLSRSPFVLFGNNNTIIILDYLLLHLRHFDITYHSLRQFIYYLFLIFFLFLFLKEQTDAISVRWQQGPKLADPKVIILNNKVNLQYRL